MKILVVDDDPITRRALESLLTRRGYDVVTAVDGEQAYDLLQMDGAPRLAIIDWMMPGMSGVDLCRKLRAADQSSRTHVIMLTGKRGKDDFVTGLDAGADDYVRKPFDIDELHARLRAAQRLIGLQEHLRVQANVDVMTGLLNRSAIRDVLRRVLAHAARENTAVSVALADIDEFRQLNDSYGHIAGDAALRRVAKLLGARLRPYDFVGRYGGEEFLLVLPGCGPDDAFEIAERVRTYIVNQGISTPAGSLKPTLSFGVASSIGGALDLEELICAADQALHCAKHAGRNRTEGPLADHRGKTSKPHLSPTTTFRATPSP
jgi:diguanylate cyclase (GGDEF)-like protein